MSKDEFEKKNIIQNNKKKEMKKPNKINN